jgi:hypothetical protein
MRKRRVFGHQRGAGGHIQRELHTYHFLRTPGHPSSQQEISIFAIRDFNINPLLIRHSSRCRQRASTFRLCGTLPHIFRRTGNKKPDHRYNFQRRPQPDDRNFDRAKKAYRAIRLCIIPLAAGFLRRDGADVSLCWTGTYDAASAANMMSFMFLWLVRCLWYLWGSTDRPSCFTAGQLSVVNIIALVYNCQGGFFLV